MVHMACVNISIHIPRVGDDLWFSCNPAAPGVISIHIPRVGDDMRRSTSSRMSAEISIHIPRVGDDPVVAYLPVPVFHFNPHPPCGG